MEMQQIIGMLARILEKAETDRTELTANMKPNQAELQATSEETHLAIEAAKREFQSQLEEVEARVERRIRACASAAQPPKLDGTTSWAVFRRLFDTVAAHNCWTPQEESTCLITALQGRAADVLHGIPINATYEETLHTLEDRFGDEHFAVAYRSQLKSRRQRAGESLQEFAIDIELAHLAYATLPEESIRQEAGKAFVDGVEDPNIKIQLLLRGGKTVSEALRQALELQAVLLVARPHKTSARTFWGADRPPLDEGTPGNQFAGTVENQATSSGAAPTEGSQ
jgi:ribosome-associated translation inhibitor RaiA